MIRKTHQFLSANRITRGFQRRIVGFVKASMNCPDAYTDISKLIRRTSPAALLDIGSHHGLTISRLLESDQIPIHGFEPTPKTFEKLSKRFKNNPLVALHNIALSDKTGEAPFFCNSNEQTNSLLENDQGNLEAFSDQTHHVASQTITTVRMDEWMAENLPSEKVIVKSDIQGAEGLLLAGGMDSFRNQVIGFFSEAQIAPMYESQKDFCAIHRLLVDELGFVLHNIYPCMHDKRGRAVQTDALWIKQEFMLGED